MPTAIRSSALRAVVTVIRLSQNSNAKKAENQRNNSKEDCRAEDNRDQEEGDRVMPRRKVLIHEHHIPVEDAARDHDRGDDEQAAGERKRSQRISRWLRLTHARACPIRTQFVDKTISIVEAIRCASKIRCFRRSADCQPTSASSIFVTPQTMSQWPQDRQREKQNE